MPNHLHFLIYYRQTDQSLNKILGTGKRFLAYEFVKRLKSLDRKKTLSMLSEGVQKKDKSRGKLHAVWSRSFDIKECRNEKFFSQKLRYIHNNPCNGKWKPAKSFVDYPHSSASYYVNGEHAMYAVTDYRTLPM